MNDTLRDVRRLSADGYCCSQIMVLLGIEATDGDDNPELLEALAGLCGGMHSGMCCGVLTGAACLLSLLDRENAKLVMVPQLTAWFRETCSARYGGINCDEIIDGDPVNKMDRCPAIMAGTFEKCRELLSNCGHEI